MRETRLLMGMPITVDDRRRATRQSLLDDVFAYFAAVDARFSVFKPESEISALNQGRLAACGRQPRDAGSAGARRTHEDARRDGYFDIRRRGRASRSLRHRQGLGHSQRRRSHPAPPAVQNFFVDAGGDIQTGGKNARRRGRGRSASATRSTTARSSRRSTPRGAASRPPAPMCAVSTFTIRFRPGGRSRTSSA